ncbi:MAG: hypothetical protein KDD89_01550 [Anaerolineales bacterium]|nr:hypothetical protein [Anaerolineales bacterium]
MSDLIGLALGLLLTLFVFSYVLGDNWLYRLAVHLLVGVSAGYAAVVVTFDLLVPLFLNWPRMLVTAPLQGGLLTVPVVLGLAFVLARATPRTARVGNLALAVLVGIGAAVALVGALVGTLLPQLLSAGSGSPVVTFISVLITICVLFYFHHQLQAVAVNTAVSAPRWQQLIGGTIGRALLMMTLGAVFASLINTSLTVLTAHLASFTQFVVSLLA